LIEAHFPLDGLIAAHVWLHGLIEAQVRLDGLIAAQVRLHGFIAMYFQLDVLRLLWLMHLLLLPIRHGTLDAAHISRYVQQLSTDMSLPLLTTRDLERRGIFQRFFVCSLYTVE